MGSGSAATANDEFAQSVVNLAKVDPDARFIDGVESDLVGGHTSWFSSTNYSFSAAFVGHGTTNTYKMASRKTASTDATRDDIKIRIDVYATTHTTTND